jgi:hypothetical protein
MFKVSLSFCIRVIIVDFVSSHFKQASNISQAFQWFCVSLLNKCSSINFSYLILVRFSIRITSNFKQCANVRSKFFCLMSSTKAFSFYMSIRLQFCFHLWKLRIFHCAFCDCAYRKSRIVSLSTKPIIIFVFLQTITATGTLDSYKLLSRIVLQ